MATALRVGTDFRDRSQAQRGMVCQDKNIPGENGLVHPL